MYSEIHSFQKLMSKVLMFIPKIATKVPTLFKFCHSNYKFHCTIMNGLIKY